MATEYQLNLVPVKVTELPWEEKLIAQGQSVLDTTTSWKEGKTFYDVVKTSSRTKSRGESANWHCRVSEHGPEEVTFDEFWEKLGVNKGENEVQYVEEVKKVTLIKRISPTMAIWSKYYTFPPPVTPRVFTVLQVTQLTEAAPRTGLIVSIPVDLSADSELAKLEEKGVRGHYVSVERIQELENGKVEWRMATSSKAGGFIPQSMTELSMAGSISKDVVGFLNWVKSTKAPPTPTQEPLAETTSTEVQATSA